MKHLAPRQKKTSKSNSSIQDIDVELGVLARIAFHGEEPDDTPSNAPISALDLEDMGDYAEHQIDLASGKVKFGYPNPDAKRKFEPLIPEFIENARSNESMARRILELLELRKSALPSTGKRERRAA